MRKSFTVLCILGMLLALCSCEERAPILGKWVLWKTEMFGFSMENTAEELFKEEDTLTFFKDGTVEKASGFTEYSLSTWEKGKSDMRYRIIEESGSYSDALLEDDCLIVYSYGGGRMIYLRETAVMERTPTPTSTPLEDES